jgi:hypothetical protein
MYDFMQLARLQCSSADPRKIVSGVSTVPIKQETNRTPSEEKILKEIENK